MIELALFAWICFVVYGFIIITLDRRVKKLGRKIKKLEARDE